MTRASLAVCCSFSLIFVLTAESRLHSADGESDDDTQAALRYIEIEVPQDNPKLWPRFGHRFGRPMPSEDFRRLLDAAGAPSRKLAPDASHISSVSLTGELEGEAFVGTGSLQVQHQGSDPAFVSLSGIRLALHELQWENAEPARLGSVPSGELFLLVDRTGRVDFQWSAHLKRDSSGVMSAALKLPPAHQSSLKLRVPRDYEFRATQGIVVQTGETHTVTLGGRAETRIILVPAGIADAPSGILLVDQNTRSDVAHSGIAMTAQLALRTLDRAFTSSEISLDVDAGIQVVGVLLNGRDIYW